eukprot:scaffold649920_cov42-Prasinocladus_malaysianus.AAC.1
MRRRHLPARLRALQHEAIAAKGIRKAYHKQNLTRLDPRMLSSYGVLQGLQIFGVENFRSG